MPAEGLKVGLVEVNRCLRHPAGAGRGSERRLN